MNFSLRYRVSCAMLWVIAAAFASNALAGSPAVGLASAGAAHACAASRGGVQCWGRNEYGQLGDGTHRERLYPAYVRGLEPGMGAVTVAAGEQHSCAVVNAGVKCWGDNGQGQLGVAGVTESDTPMDVFPAGSGITAVAAGWDHTCAIRDGSLWCWGANFDGQLGNGTTDSPDAPILIIGGGVSAVAASNRHTCAIVNGGLRCWGDNSAGQLGLGTNDPAITPQDVPQMDSNVTAVAAGAVNTCAVVNQATMFCWGSNDSGQLGTGNNTPSNAPTQVANIGSIGTITSIAIGGDDNFSAAQACAVLDGALMCWGDNSFGQLGDGTFEAQNVPETIAAGLAAVATGFHHTCSVAADNGIYCAGSDDNGQVGDHGQPIRVPSPTLVGTLGGFHGIEGGGSHGCGVLAGDAYCWGANAYGQLGRGNEINDAWPDRVVFNFADGSIGSVTVGSWHSCATTITAGAWCWGYNSRGQLGSNGGASGSSLPVDTTVGGVVEITAGGLHTCVALASGGASCWGAGTSGQLGGGASADSATPIVVMRIAGQFPIPLSGVTAIAAGQEHTCAVSDGGARCWGANNRGQLGDGTTTTSNTARSVLGLAQLVDDVAVGTEHSCALQDGTVQCWGSNAYNQLGNGTAAEAHQPVSVLVGEQDMLVGVTAIASGSHHNCVVVDGGVACWGFNASGQLGIGSFEPAAYATSALAPGLGVTEITAGAEHACATAGALTWCWGRGYDGRLANGSLGYSAHFVIADSIFVGEFPRND